MSADALGRCAAKSSAAIVLTLCSTRNYFNSLAVSKGMDGVIWRPIESNNDVHSPIQSSTQRRHDVLITSLLRQNDVVTSFWRNYDVIHASRVHWAVKTSSLHIYQSRVSWRKTRPNTWTHHGRPLHVTKKALMIRRIITMYYIKPRGSLGVYPSFAFCVTCAAINALNHGKTAAIWQTTVCKCIFLDEKCSILIQFWLRFVP